MHGLHAHPLRACDPPRSRPWEKRDEWEIIDGAGVRGGERGPAACRRWTWKGAPRAPDGVTMTRTWRRPAQPQNVIRAAGPEDFDVVRELDDLVFPPDSRDGQRAEPGELEDGILAGDVHVIERAGEVVAYLHTDRSRPNMIFVSGIAVRPDAQGLGLGTMMIDHFLDSLPGQIRGSVPITTITSPRNFVMLRL